MRARVHIVSIIAFQKTEFNLEVVTVSLFILLLQFLKSFEMKMARIIANG